MSNTLTGFGSRLTEKLAEQKISQADLCRMTGLASSMISHYCNGQRVPSVPTAIKIAEALNTTIEDLALYSHLKSDSHDTTQLSVSENGAVYKTGMLLLEHSECEQALLYIFRKLNTEGRNKAIGYLEDLQSTGKYE